MKFCGSAEIDKDVGPSYSRLRNEIEKKINDFLEHRDYGDAVNELWILDMILGEEFLQAMKWPERRRYSQKKGY